MSEEKGDKSLFRGTNWGEQPNSVDVLVQKG